MSSSASWEVGVKGFSTITATSCVSERRLPSLQAPLGRTMLSGFQCQLCQTQMCVRGGRHNNHVESLVCDHFICRTPDFDARMVFLRIVVRLWAALHDCMKFEIGYSENERDMKDL